MIQRNQLSHRQQGYFVPTALQQQLGLPLNQRGFIERETEVNIIIDNGAHIIATANGYGSINTDNHQLRNWFRDLGDEEEFEVQVVDGQLIFNAL